LDYWTDFGKKWIELVPSEKPCKLQAANWMPLSIGRMNFFLKIKMNARENQILAGLVLGGLEAKPHFCLLRGDRKEI